MRCRGPPSSSREGARARRLGSGWLWAPKAKNRAEATPQTSEPRLAASARSSPSPVGRQDDATEPRMVRPWPGARTTSPSQRCCASSCVPSPSPAVRSPPSPAARQDDRPPTRVVWPCPPVRTNRCRAGATPTATRDAVACGAVRRDDSSRPSRSETRSGQAPQGILD